MEQYKLGEMEQKFADMIWANEPVSSRVLTELCEAEFSWKRTTTYTMLKRLCDRGIFANNSGTVTALMSKAEFGAAQGEQFLKDAFNGSLPQFLAAFTRRKKLTAKEIADIQRLIDNHKEG
ncbi:BlaI/MecI/CopY family transcriptional regulator [Diplocloster agilis]|uniref:BlaI/MecI/CopY family transcriptional regulator n=1 Tax=Diplocloster agilis TaxID=2850323 RepID=UPI0008226301|nr:BlaI/MecI/CopY family transcriptional regulator [Suonthocola fibrivorans]MCU6734599.1 BlaI/MecI/CopY family transcriptional regulator [Suonthocola fibrivorans]SCJ46681.1 Regulatory protein BlaI [uncultured Clostridium sp.]